MIPKQPCVFVASAGDTFEALEVNVVADGDLCREDIGKPVSDGSVRAARVQGARLFPATLVRSGKALASAHVDNEAAANRLPTRNFEDLGVLLPHHETRVHGVFILRVRSSCTHRG